jgi:UDP-N-acetylmuramoyl-L-alanyl-D-glutamate--2,6-diaminopimelate ligase
MKSKQLKEILSNIEFKSRPEIIDTVIKKIAYDSRKIVPKSLFVAIHGFSTNGHIYLKEAKKKGAVAAIVEERTEDVPIPQYVVQNSRRELARIAANFYSPEIYDMNIIGITGTNGKTTISMLLRSIMETAGFHYGLIGTILYNVANKQIKAWNTTPESVDLFELLYTMHRHKQKGCIMEVSSHALALNRVDYLHFNFAVFTNLTQDHLDFHKNLEEYFQAKKRLFTLLNKKGKAILNIEDCYGKRLQREIKHEIITYGFTDQADIYPLQWKSTLSGTYFKVCTPGDSIEIKSPLIGRFNVENILASVATGLAMDMDLKTIKQGIESVHKIPGRLEYIKSGDNKTFIVDYSHTPDALEKAIKVLKDLNPPNLWVVFGCGGNRDKTKRPIMGQIAQNLADRIVVTSDNPRYEEPEEIIKQILSGISANRNNVYVQSNRREAIKYSIENSQPGDIVLIAGKGHEDYQEIKGIKYPFDDRKIIREFIQ